MHNRKYALLFLLALLALLIISMKKRDGDTLKWTDVSNL